MLQLVNGWARRAAVSVGGGGGGGDGAPEPPAAGAGNMVPTGTIAFDTRSGAAENGASPGAVGGDLQAVANSAAMEALFYDSWPADGGDPRSLATSMDGSGTNAVRCEWQGNPTCTADGSNNDERNNGFRVYPVQTTAKAIYWQWKMRSGRHASDAGTSHGTADTFSHINGVCNVSENFNWGRKIAVFGRNQGAGTGERIDLLAPGAPGVSTTAYQIILNGADLGSGTNFGSSVDPDDYVGQTITVTLLLKAETSVSSGDGALKMWIDDTLIIDEENINTGSRHFQANDRGAEFASEWNGPYYDQTEYWWDLVCWEAE